MKTLTPALQTLLAGRQWDMASLYQLVLPNGGTLYYTSWDTDILWNGQTYSAGGSVGPYFDCTDNKAKMTQNVGTQVDTFTVEVLPGAGLVQGQPFLQAVQQGVFDGADFTYSGAYFPTGGGFTSPALPTGIVIKMVGRVAEVDAGRSSAVFNINSHLELFNQQMPRNLYQVGCTNTLFDTGCRLVKASFAVNGTVSTGTTASQILSGFTQGTGYFDMGVMTFTSGANSGISRTVKNYFQAIPSTFNLISPFPNTPAPGDTFTVYPGCDKQQSTCTQKFNNLTNFRGFPYVPVSETAI